MKPEQAERHITIIRHELTMTSASTVREVSKINQILSRLSAGAYQPEFAVAEARKIMDGVRWL